MKKLLLPNTILVLIFVCLLFSASSAMSSKPLTGVEYEVFGRVQGVFFRKYTQAKAKELGLVGWVMNTRDDTVTGKIEGPKDKVAEMKDWLQRVGSPHSRIDKCDFKNEVSIEKLNFSSFDIKH